MFASGIKQYDSKPAASYSSHHNLFSEVKKNINSVKQGYFLTKRWWLN
jgi:hypothetical protein